MLRSVDRVCPLLALTADRRTVVDGVDPGHACHAAAEPMPLERQVQAQLCLTPRHDRCERYLQYVARRGGIPGRASVADGVVSTRLVLAPEPAWRGIAGRARRGRPGRALAIGAVVVAAAAAGTALAAPAVTDGLSLLDVVASSPSPSPVADNGTPSPMLTVAPLPTASDTPPPIRSPTPTPVVTPSPSESIAPAAAITPSPTPAAAQTYVVQQGDTLASIAEEYGVGVAALQSTNGIEDPDEILIGAVLVIP